MGTEKLEEGRARRASASGGRRGDTACRNSSTRGKMRWRHTGLSLIRSSDINTTRQQPQQTHRRQVVISEEISIWIPTMPRSILRGGRYPNYLRWATYARSVVMKPVWFLPLFKFPNIYPPKHFTRGVTGTPVTTNIVCDRCASRQSNSQQLPF